jgi:hypothetical protein
MQKFGILNTSVELVSTIHFILPSRQTKPALANISSAVDVSVSHALCIVCQCLIFCFLLTLVKKIYILQNSILNFCRASIF